MPSFKLNFFVQHGRDLEPQLNVGGSTLGKLDIASTAARAVLTAELGSIAPDTLEVNGYMPVVRVDVEAEDEAQALLVGFHQATLCLAPYSLIAPEGEGIDLTRRRPVVLPHALLVDEEAEPPTVTFRYQQGPSLVRFHVGEETVTRTQSFNNSVIRRIATLYPQSLLKAYAEQCPLALRIARAVYWYSQAEAQPETTMAFVCYWIGLEALTLPSSTSPGKKKALVRRMVPLSSLHHSGNDWTALVEDLWDMRSDIVHEGFGAPQIEVLPVITASEINTVKYLFSLRCSTPSNNTTEEFR